VVVFGVDTFVSIVVTAFVEILNLASLTKVTFKLGSQRTEA